MTAHPIPLTKCPEHVQLLAFAEGTLELEDTHVLESHLADCELCDAKLASIEEQSDTLVRALASLPATADDETTFRRLQAELLAKPEPFLGNTDTTEALDGQIPLEFLLPMELGNYELLEQIGAGAHGAVFRARHKRLEREVAVKLLLHAAGSAVEDFLNEMRIVGQLDHPHIVRATDAGEHEGTYFLVMEFVPGLDVSSLLRKVGQLRVEDACEIARQTALGLEVAHDHALVHRDVKTSNLLFTVYGQIKLLDLGLATIASLHVDQPTAKTGPRGTADYMAPEQWLESSLVTPAADIYSLGCTLFKLLTGVPPYRVLPAGFHSKQGAHAAASIPRVAELRDDVPPGLDHLLQTMLAKEADLRPSSAREVARNLERYARGNTLPNLARGIFPEAAGQHPPVPRPPLSRRMLLTASLVAATAATMMLWPKPRRKDLQQGQWRPLTPSNPALIHLVADDNATMQGDADDVQLQSSAPVLLQFGRPVGPRFRWQTVLQRASWQSAAGVFFSLRRQTTEALRIAFYTIEIMATEPDAGQLRWVAYACQDRTLEEPLLLAEAAIDDPPQADVPCTVEVVLGRTGFPEIRLNQRVYPETLWARGTEARALITTSVDQLSATYAGRIGVFQQEGTTHLLGSQLMYLDR